jgi:hypothetical protein
MGCDAMEQILTPKQLREILKCLTPEQRQAIQARISDVFAKHRRSRFRLISSTYQKVLTEWMNSLAGELARLKPNDPRRAEIVKEMSQLSLLSASLTGQRDG